MVRPITHNFLSSNVRGIRVAYPLRVRADEVEHETDEFDEALTRRLVPRIDYAALLLVCAACGYDSLPPQPPAELDQAFLMALHHALFNINIVRGAFICPESGREFPIEGGIPNMVLNEDEV